MSRVILTQPEREAIFEQIGTILASAILDEWEELRFHFTGVVDVTTMGLSVVRPDGSVQQINAPRRAARLMRELREGMYEPDRGAWFTARYAVSSAGGYQVEFDYDGEPQLGFPLASTSYAADLAEFPRADTNIPDWLREHLTMAAG